MALIDCLECGKSYSDLSPTCPNCAAPTPGAATAIAKQPEKRKAAFWQIALTAVVCFLMVKCAWDMRSDSNLPVAEKSPAEIQADKEFQVAVAVGRAIKNASKDPSSFKMESFMTFPGGAACYEFRAKNSFGAVVPAKAVYDGKDAWHSEKNGNQFVKVWNRICTRPGGTERASGLNYLGAWN